MHAEVGARTAKGFRWFLVSGASEADAAATLRAVIERRERVFDEFGEQFEASQVDASSIGAQGAGRATKLGASRFTTDGQRVTPREQPRQPPKRNFWR